MPDGNPTGVVHGLILTAALLAVESTAAETLPEAAGSVALGVGILWLAHTYSAALGDRLHRPAPWSARHLWDVAVHESRLLHGAAVPLLTLVVAALSGVADSAAVLAALVATLVALLVLELAAGVASHLGRIALLGQALLSLAIGAGILALKIVAH